PIYDDESAPLSAQTQAAMDAQVQALLERLYDRTRDILTSHRDALNALAEALLERETIEGDEALRIMGLTATAGAGGPFAATPGVGGGERRGRAEAHAGSGRGGVARAWRRPPCSAGNETRAPSSGAPIDC